MELKMISSGVKSLYFVIIVIMEWWKLYLTRKPCCLAELQLYHLKYCNNFPADINISWLTWDSDIISVVGTLLTVICGSDPKWRVVSCISLLCCIIIVFSRKYNEARGLRTDSLFIIVTLWHCDTVTLQWRIENWYLLLTLDSWTMLTPVRGHG